MKNCRLMILFEFSTVAAIAEKIGDLKCDSGLGIHQQEISETLHC